MRSAKLIAAAVPTISFGQNLVTETTKVPQTQSYQGFAGLVVQFRIIPTRCRDLHLKQFCLEDVVPAVLIILITHIILAVRWILIKILSVVINHHGTVITVVSGGCHLMIVLYAKPTQKSRCCGDFTLRIFAGYDRRLPLGLMGASS